MTKCRTRCDLKDASFWRNKDLKSKVVYVTILLRATDNREFTDINSFLLILVHSRSRG